MENDDDKSEEDTRKETVCSELSNCLSATDTQDVEAVMSFVLAKTEEGATRNASAKPEKTGRAKRREKRLKNEPQSVLSEEGPSGVHVLDFAEARATELNHMVKAMRSKGGSKRAFQGLPRHMRRRAMSHNVKRLPHRLRKKAEIEMEKSSGLDAGTPKKKGSRKQRRKPANLKKEYERRQRKYAWLETHIWHAKRMKMVNKSYGFRLAEHCSDKGVRAAYRSLIHGCMLSDISYYCCTEVTGEQNRIINCLSSLFNSNTGLTIGAKAYMSGQREGKATMYKHGAYPYGAIGPVQFLWQAPPPQKPVVSVEDALTAHSPVFSRPTKLWIWSHPAMQEQVLLEVQARVAAHGVVSVSAKSVKLDLVRFRLIGPRSHALLMETLKPVFDFSPPVEEAAMDPNDAEVPHLSIPRVQAWWNSESDHSSVHSDILSSCYSSIKSVSSPAQFSRGSVLGMTVYDPRLTTPVKRTDMVSAYYPKPRRGSSLLQNLLNGEDKSDTGDYSDEESEDEESSSGEYMECESILPEGVFEESPRLSASTSQTFSSPSVLPMGVAYSPIWDSSVRETVSDDKIKEHLLNTCRSQQFVRSSTLDLQDKANRIPVLLIQQSLQSSDHSAVAGWDLILPLNWAMEFWMSLIYRGARACGMKELRKCSLEIQAPHFPHDYPDTAAGRQNSFEQKEALELRYHSLPPDKRRNYGKLLISSPFFSPWIELISKWKTSLPPKLRQILPSHFQTTDEDDSDLLQPSKKPKLDTKEAPQLDQGLQVVLKSPHAVNQEASNSPGFYVIRCKDALRTLFQFIEYVFKHKKQQRMSTLVAGSSSSVGYSDTFFQSCMFEFQIVELLHEHASALFAVKFETNQRGTVGDRATISVPCDSDLRSLVTTVRRRPFSGPKEEINQKGLTVVNGKSVCVGISSLTRKQIKEVKQIHKLREKARRDQDETSAVVISPVEEFKLCPVMPSRQEFGYVTTAGLRLTTSHSSGTGFCTFAGLLETVRRCYAARDIYELLALARGEDIQYWIIKLQLHV